MSFMDKIRTMMSASEDDYYDDEEFEVEREEAPSYKQNRYQDSYSSYSSPSYTSSSSSRDSLPSYSSDRKGKIVNLASGNQLQVVLVKPERFEDATAIADHLNAKRTVVLNLESASRETTRRLVDFLSGVAYANNGQMKRVANSTFMITPFNVDVMGDVVLEEIESSGLYN